MSRGWFSWFVAWQPYKSKIHYIAMIAKELLVLAAHV